MNENVKPKKEYYHKIDEESQCYIRDDRLKLDILLITGEEEKIINGLLNNEIYKFFLNNGLDLNSCSYSLDCDKVKTVIKLNELIRLMVEVTEFKIRELIYLIDKYIIDMEQLLKVLDSDIISMLSVELAEDLKVGFFESTDIEKHFEY
jgi:hypothetical protein